MHDIRAFFVRYSSEIFHLPYYLAQTAIGEDEGAAAGLFDCDSRGYGSGFANAGGHVVVETLLDHFEANEIIARVTAMEELDIEVRFERPELMTRDSIEGIAEDVARLWHKALAQSFPEVAEIVGDPNPSSIRAVRAYLEFRHAYSDEYRSADERMSRGSLSLG